MGYTDDMNPKTFVILLIVATPAAAAAQDRTGAFVGGGVSAANMASRTDFAFDGAFGYRFNRVVSLEIEATGIPGARKSGPIGETDGFGIVPVTGSFHVPGTAGGRNSGAPSITTHPGA